MAVRTLVCLVVLLQLALASVSQLDQATEMLWCQSNVNVPLTVQSKNGVPLQYYANIAVGTPAQKIPVVFDTGSTDLVFASQNCTGVNCPAVRFNATKSSTTTYTGEPFVDDYDTGGGTIVNQQESLEGNIVNDYISFGSLQRFTETINLYSEASDGFRHQPYSGILGMPNDPASAVAQLLAANALPVVYSFALRNPVSLCSSEVTLGGMDSRQYNNPVLFLSMVPAPHWVSVELAGVTVNSHSVMDPTEFFVGFDTSTAGVVVPPNTMANILQAIPTLVPYPPQNASMGAYMFPCSHPPAFNLQLTFASGFSLTLNAANFNLGPIDPVNYPGYCEAALQTGISWILGSPLLKQYYTVFDVTNSRVGFASLSSC